MSHGTIYHAYVMFAAANNRGKITRKAVILVSQKKKRTLERCVKIASFDRREHPSENYIGNGK